LKKRYKFLGFLICTLIILSFFNSISQIETTDPKLIDFFPQRIETKLNLGDFAVTEHTTVVNIIDLDNILVDETIRVRNNQNDTDSISMWANQNHTNLIISDSEDNHLSYDYVNDTNLVIIALNTQMNTSDAITLFFEYDLIPNLEQVNTQGRKKTAEYTLRFYQTISYPTSKYTLKIGLPRGFYERYNPIPSYDEYIQSGARLFYSWEYTEIQETPSQLSFALFFNELLPKSSPIWGYVIGILVGLIAGSCIVYLLMRRGSSKLEEELEKIYLTKNQQLLLKLIEEKQGKVTQQEIIKITNFTKSKVSRNLTPLEESGLITKEKWGREYKVEITKKGLKVAEKIVARELQFSKKLNEPDISKVEDTMYR